jgi:hypothetical protein
VRETTGVRWGGGHGPRALVAMRRAPRRCRPCGRGCARGITRALRDGVRMRGVCTERVRVRVRGARSLPRLRSARTARAGSLHVEMQRRGCNRRARRARGVSTWRRSAVAAGDLALGESPREDAGPRLRSARISRSGNLHVGINLHVETQRRGCDRRASRARNLHVETHCRDVDRRAPRARGISTWASISTWRRIAATSTGAHLALGESPRGDALRETRAHRGRNPVTRACSRRRSRAPFFLGVASLSP